jgi:hypothetical protein
MQQLEHDDMAREHSAAKPTAIERKPLGTRRAPSPQLPQINPPLSNGGQEQVRDSNC